MSCNTCSKSFGLITREKDCKNCGFSYCSSCLRYKQFVAKINQNVKVCGPCNRVLSDPKVKDAAPRSPPSALKKRLERLNSLPEAKHPVTVYKDGNVAKLRFGLPAQDQEIADRLQQLKSAGTQPNNEESEEEIRARLNRLRGVDEKPEGASSQQNILITKPDQPAVIQADHLLKQIGEQVVIERDIPNPDEELEERLAKLKGVEVGQIRHPGKGLESDPSGSAHEDSLLLHDHSSYTIIHSTVEDQDEAELAKDITNINKEKENVNAQPSDPKRIWTIKEIREKQEAERAANEDTVVEEDDGIQTFKIETVPYHIPVKEEKVDVAKFANEYGIIETVDTDLTCKMCLHGYKYKERFLEHCRTDCLSICQWKDCEKEAEEHEHEWVNIAFVNEVDAMNYARDKLDAEFLYSKNYKNYSESNTIYIQYFCRPGLKGTKCRASLRIRKSKRYVSEHILVPVYELIGCVYHNHPLEFKPCLAQHEHDPIDKTFPNLEEAEACLTQLQKIHTYRRRDCIQEGGRVYLNCKKKDYKLGGVCKAHVHLVQRPKSDGTLMYRVKGCLAHCHPPTKHGRDKFCSHDHEHQIIDMKFKTLADFQAYLEESELDCQFSKHTAALSAHTKTRCHQYICSRHTFWKNRYKRKKKVVDAFDCPARMYLVEPQIKTEKTAKVKNDSNTEQENFVHLTGCLAHNHPSAQSKFSVKFRKDVYSRMDQLNMSEEQKSRNFRRFRDLVLQLKKKHGEGFLAEFKSEDVNVSRDLISFKDHFLLRYPQAANSALSSTKSFHAVLKSRRELKKKKLLERLRYVHNLVEQMDLNEENEDYMDRTSAAIKAIPGLVEAFGKQRKPQRNEDQPQDETEIATSSILQASSSSIHEISSNSPAKKKRKPAVKRKQETKEEIHEVVHHIEHVEHVEHVEQGVEHGQPVEEYYVTDESFPYTVIRTTEQGHSFIETENGTTMQITFR